MHLKPLARAFERIIRTDRPYAAARVRDCWRLWRDGDDMPAWGTRRYVAGEQLYNEVTVGAASREALAAQEGARLLFDLDRFKEDYSLAKADVRRLGPLKKAAFKDYVKVKGERMPDDLAELLNSYRDAVSFVAQYRSVAEQIKSWPRAQRTGTVPIRSGFFKIINRRFEAAHLWPIRAQGQMDREAVRELIGSDDGPDGIEWFHHSDSSPRGRWFRAPDGHPLVGKDVSSSQTQILGVLLNLPDLEQLAARRPFKAFLSELAWESRAWLLREGYEGQEDDRLAELVKAAWMRVGYGSELHRIVADQGRDAKLYGPGWVGVEALERFLLAVPGFDQLRAFLEAMRRVGETADTYTGLGLRDPFDGAAFTWNPLLKDRATAIQLHGGLRVWLYPPAGPMKAGRWPVDVKALRNMVAPCIVHALDAAYSGFVMRELVARGVSSFTAIHDCWLVPAYRLRDLEAAMGSAAAPWLKSLGVVYDALEPHLEDEYRLRWLAARAAWSQRVAEERWPSFLAKSSELVTSRIGEPELPPGEGGPDEPYDDD